MTLPLTVWPVELPLTVWPVKLWTVLQPHPDTGDELHCAEKA